MESVSAELFKEEKPYCRRCRQRVDYAVISTGGTESPQGRVVWTVTVRCHGDQRQQDLLLQGKPDLTNKIFF